MSFDKTADGSLHNIELRLASTNGGGSEAAPGTRDGLRPTGAGHGDGGGDEAAPPEVQYRTYKRRWFGLVQLILLNIIVSWDWLTFAPVAEDAAAYYSVSLTALNWLSTSFLFAFVVASPAVIPVLHWGPKPAFVTASLLILVGNWIRYAGSHARAGGSYGVVMFGQILTGLGQPFVLAAPTRFSDLWFTSRGRVAATAITSLANPVGAALAQLIVPLWVNSPGDTSAMVLYVAVISSVCCVPTFFVPAAPPTPAAPSSATPKTSLTASARAVASSPELWLILVPFAVYVGFFNSLSSLVNQMMVPYGFSDDDAGIGGGLLIIVGLVAAAVTSPILDRTKAFVPAIKVLVPVLALSLLAFVWMPATRTLPGPYVVLSVVGAAAFSLVPIALECLTELSHPVSPEVVSTVAWAGGQLLGGIFIIVSNALQSGPDADPPGNMNRALIFQAVVSLVVMPMPIFLGWFGRSDYIVLKRIRSDQEGNQLQTVA